MQRIEVVGLVGILLPACHPYTWRKAEADIRYREEQGRLEWEEEQSARVSNRDRERETDFDVIAPLHARLGEMNIQIGDDWNPDALRAVIAYMETTATRFTNAITLFGLRQSRGNQTYGYDLNGYERATDLQMNRHMYGVTRDIRMNNHADMVQAIMVQICQLEERVPISTPREEPPLVYTPDMVMETGGQPRRSIRSLRPRNNFVYVGSERPLNNFRIGTTQSAGNDFRPVDPIEVAIERLLTPREEE